MGAVATARGAFGRTADRVPAATRTGAREQVLVVAGQLASGAGNLAFALIMARLLEPAVFTELARFLALYLVLHIPMSSLSAASALSPEGAPEAQRKARRIGGFAALALMAGALPLAIILDIPVVASLGLAASAPVAGLLALERGRLYGVGRHGRAVASLIAEPAVRVGVGIMLAMMFGVAGGVIGVVAAGYVALAVARIDHAGTAALATQLDRSGANLERTTTLTVTAFVLLALIQNQDLLLAGRLLDTAGAANFAALSTLGGAAAFALATIPVVLLPRAAQGDEGALGTALTVGAALGGGAVLIAALAPELIVTSVFGDRYVSITQLLVPYLGAMTFLGLGRVLVANLCARGFAGTGIKVVGFAGVVHLILLLALARTASEMAIAALVSTGILLATAATATVIRLVPTERAGAVAARLRHPGALFLGAVMIVGLILRLLVTRGIWLDEATTVAQIQLSFGDMFESLRTSDVHPPLHYVVLWLSSRVLGISEMAVRMPSIIAGLALIPAVYALGKELYDVNTARLAAVLTAVAPFAVWYSQEARMYGFFMLFGVLAVFGQVRALRTGRTSDWAIYALASAALVWTQYMGVLLVLVQQLAFLVMFIGRLRRGEEVKPLLAGWACATGVLALLLAALAPLAYQQYTVNEEAGKGFAQLPSQTGSAASEVQGEVSIYSAIANGVWAMWGYHSDRTMAQIAALWPLGMLSGLLFLGRGRSRQTTLLAAAIAVPALMLAAIGFYKQNLFEVRYIAMAVPLVLLLMARFITSWAPGKVARLAAAGALSVTMLVGLADQQLNGTNPRLYDFRGALGEVSQRADSNDVVVYKPIILKSLVRYYAPELDAQTSPPEPAKGRRVFVVGSFLEMPGTRAQVDEVRKQIDRRETLADRFDYPNVRVWVYE
ncbi:MAG: glycosyltransferase family 39 protein [Actinomycetota bacterium]